MGKLKKAVACAGVLAAAGIGEVAYFYRRTMKRGNAKVERTIKMSGTDWSQYAPMMEKRKAFMMAQAHEDVYQTSFDGLKLHATYFPALEEYANKRKVAICFHGYTSQGMSDYIGLSDYYLKRGYAMLLPDARAHGESEGEYIGFGCLDRKDALVWINWVIQELGEDVGIVLHGTSMGGATVLMASGLELPGQVKGIVSDCAFTSPKEVFTHVLHSMYHLPAFPAIPGADILNRRLAGYGMDEERKREVAKAKFRSYLSMDEDSVCAYHMCREYLMTAVRSPRKILEVEGAAARESYYKDTESYERGTG